MGWFHKVRICLIVSTAIMLIVIAVSFSVMRALLPHATGYIEDIQKTLSSQIGLPVTFTSIDADMNWLTPRLKIIDLVIFRENGKDELIHLKEANFSLAYIDSIRYRTVTIGAIDLLGAELFIERHENDRWVVQGIEFSGGPGADINGSSQFVQTLKNMNFSLVDNHIHWRDFTGETENIELRGVDIKVETFFGDHSFDVRLKLPKQYGKTLQLTAELAGDIFKIDQLQGKIFFKGKRINLENWADIPGLDRETKASGIVDASVWLDFDRKKIKRVSGKIKNSGIEIKKRKHPVAIWSAQQLEFMFLYRKLSNGWRVDVKDLVVTRDNKQWSGKSALLIKKTTDIETLFRSDYLKLQDVLPLVKLWDDKKYEELGLGGLKGSIYNLDAIIQEKNDGRSISAEFEDLAYDFKDRKICGEGFDGTVAIEDDEIRLSLDSRQLNIDIADMFRSPIGLDVVEGELIIDSSSHGYTMRSQGIHVANRDLKLDTRFDIVSTRISYYMDMQADFFDVDTRHLSRYYPVSELSAELIAWLDGAIQGGRVEKGSYVFRGDTGDFPFYDNSGVMEVDFAVKDLKLHYLDGWPDLNNIDADIRFYNESLSIQNARGKIQGSDVRQISAVIPDLNHAYLTVGGKTHSDAETLQRFVFNSGLNDILGDALRTIHLQGGTALEFGLDVPLDEETAIKTKGKLTFSDARLDYPAMQYQLTGINGSLSFTEANMTAKDISARFAGRSVDINIEAIDTAEISETVFHIDGDIGIKPLLKTFDWIPSGWVDGNSDWDIGIHIPYTEEDYQVRVTGHSDMGNVSFAVSDALQKKPDSKLPVDIEILVFDKNLTIDAESEEVFTVRAARDEDNSWQVSVDSDPVSGVIKFEQGMSPDSTVFMDLDSITLDAFATRNTGSGADTLLPSSFPALELRAKKLLWDDWAFSNASLFSDRHPQGMVIRDLKLEGPSLLVDAQGSWLYSWQHKHESSFKINVSSENLGAALEKMGLTKNLKRTRLSSTSDWQWQGAPYSFSWAKVKGSTQIQLSDGEMQDVDPGAGGRLLGLLNVLQIPKRVTLDFDDVYKEGLVFDDVTANFKLEDGNATSTHVDIKAAAAKMKMFGRIGMHDRDYDLEVLVKPHSSAATFTGGTIAGGPVFGAGLVLIQKLLGLDKAAYDQYAITGPWDNPVVTQISRREAEEQ